MITLYSYPELFGVVDNNPYGLKIFAFLKLAKLQFTHLHIFDAKAAPRGQLPYIVDDGAIVGDSDAIIAHVTAKYALTMDRDRTDRQRTTDHLIRRTLDDLYWVMSYSRWRDDRFWPSFKDEMLRTHSNLTDSGMEAARQYNFERYRYQGIGRYEPADVYARGVADLQALADVTPASEFLFGPTASSIDAAAYGFVANIVYFNIDTPLKRFVQSHATLVRHVDAIHALITI
jgi:glutathione S-transferase